jgi:hypothetical protein
MTLLGRNDDSVESSDVSVPMLVVVHMPGNVNCICDQCLAFERSLESIDIPDTSGGERGTSAATVTPPGPSRSRSRTEPSRNESGEVSEDDDLSGGRSPQRQRTTAMTLYVATERPVGPFANGAAGPSSVMVPRGYNLQGLTDMTLLNRLSVLSGTMEFQVSSGENGNQVSSNQRHMEDLAESAELAKAYFGASGIDVSDSFVGVNPYVSSIVAETCFTAMAAVGMTYCNTIADCIAQTEQGPRLKFNGKFNFLLQAFPFDKLGNRSTIANPHGKTLFSRSADGKAVYTRDFYRGFLEVKNRRDGGLFSNLDILFSIPSFAVPDLQMDAHLDACEIMSQIGPGSSMPRAFQLSLKQAYAHHFINVMSSEMVSIMVENGWIPLWLMKNCLLSKCDRTYAPTGSYFTSLDKTPKSYIHLVGFFRGTKEGKDLSIVTLTNRSNHFVRIAN